MIDTSKALRFMSNNFLETGYAALTVSSADANNPFANCLDPLQRTKTFKFGGRFTIDATNNKVYVNGITYTIASGEYTGATLATAISNLITPAYVLYFPVDRIFQFLGENYVLNTSQVANAVWTTIGFTTGVDRAITSSETSADATRIHWPNEKVTIDFGYQAAIGFFGMIGDLAQEFRIPQGATISFKANTVNDEATALVNVTIPWYTRGALRFIDDIAGAGWRYVWLTITCPTGAFQPEIGYLYIGDYSVLPDDRNIGTGFDEVWQDNTMLSSSDNGQIYGNPRVAMRGYESLQVGVAKPAVTAFLKNLYKLKGLTVPFFICLDPTSYLSSTFDEHLAFVRFTSPPRSQHILRDMFEVGFSVRETV